MKPLPRRRSPASKRCIQWHVVEKPVGLTQSVAAIATGLGLLLSGLAALVVSVLEAARRLFGW